MKKANLVQDAKLDPSRYYRNPSDVVRDRRLTNQDRLEILAAWEHGMRERRQNDESGDPASETLQQILRVRAEFERSLHTVSANSEG